MHAHDFYGIMVRGLNVPRVFTVHGFIHEDTRYGGQRFARLRALLWRRVELACWREQPHIVSISPYVRERLRGIARGVIHDIENPIAEECFTVRSPLERSIIFSAAALCERKNTLGLLAAFQLLVRQNPAAKLRLAGKVTEPAYGRAVQEFIRDHGLSGGVDLLGNIPSVQVRAELAGASVFALVSFEEGAPMGIAEAMAAGLPVVTSNRCGMPYMVRHGETGFLVNPDDPADVAGCLGRILLDRPLAAGMSARALEAAIDRFHPDRVAGQTFALYQDAVSQFHSETHHS
jgi:glycosyltransferase involved in cell wall biosynthesis